ncbi:MAG: hypothetical protein J6S56_05420 [Bacteroidales bacterium]|nr:hypothetical protein [Bacteroidales bacterium]
MKKGKALEKLKLRERNKVKEVSKYIISAFLVVLFLHGRMCVVAQSPTIQNDEVLFSLVFTSYSVLDSIYSPMKFHVLIENHPKQMILDHYAQMDTSMLFSLLDNPKYDWATNLVLYNVYDVDASMFFAFDIKTREDWINYFQDKDTTMWHDFFKHRKGTQSIKVE